MSVPCVLWILFVKLVCKLNLILVFHIAPFFMVVNGTYRHLFLSQCGCLQLFFLWHFAFTKLEMLVYTDSYMQVLIAILLPWLSSHAFFRDVPHVQSRDHVMLYNTQVFYFLVLLFICCFAWGQPFLHVSVEFIVDMTARAIRHLEKIYVQASPLQDLGVVMIFHCFFFFACFICYVQLWEIMQTMKHLFIYFINAVFESAQFWIHCVVLF